jgi:hypothetical protein
MNFKKVSQHLSKLSLTNIMEAKKLEKVIALNKDIYIIMENLSEEFEFCLANYYAISKNGQYLSSADQPHIVDYDEDMQNFLQYSK